VQLLASVNPGAADTPSEALAAVRAAAEGRRRHDSAVLALRAVRQRAAMYGEAAAIDRAIGRLRDELAARGGDPALVECEQVADDSEAHRLEALALHARQAAHAATARARELRARLGGLLDAAPDLAELDDEREACLAARDRCLQQLAALRGAEAFIDTASRQSHRDLAPVLAERIAAGIRALTDSRYLSVNVDTEHFRVALLTAERPDMVPLELLSHGTRDQVSLLLRVALCEVLSTSGERAPLLLDEPVLTADPARRELLIEFLHELSTTHQVVLTSSDPSLVDIVASVARHDHDVVRLSASVERRKPKLVALAR
jgi:uncharacterized protein YhaN